MAKDYGSSVKDDKQYEGLRKKGMSKQRAAKIREHAKCFQERGEEVEGGKRRRHQGGAAQGRQEVLLAGLS